MTRRIHHAELPGGAKRFKQRAIYRRLDHVEFAGQVVRLRRSVPSRPGPYGCVSVRHAVKAALKHRSLKRFAPLLIGIFLLGCHRHAHVAETTPTPPVLAWPGVKFQEVVLSKFPERERLWIYIPDDGRRTHPCVFIAPAGSNLVTGMRLSDGDRSEQLPYARAGYVVVAYDVSGPKPQDNGDAAGIAAAIRLFAKREVGLLNGRAAIDYALKSLPVDPLRLYSAGHSSAGTLALLLASTDSRIRGCIAYAPITDVTQFMAAGLADEVRYHAPEYVATLEKYSPMALRTSLQCPVLLFSAQDDEVVPPDTVKEYAEALKRTNKQVDLVTVASGGHYDSMISSGIPAGIEWLGRNRPRK